MSEQNYREFFEEALSQIHEEYKNNNQEDDFKLWFRMSYVEDTISQITVSVASEFMWKQMNSRGSVEKIQKKITELTGLEIQLNHIVQNKPAESEQKTEIPQTPQKKEESPEEKIEISNDSEIKPSKAFKKHPQLRDDYTFENFVTGENSEYAYQVCMAAARDPGDKYNPILIYGGVGLGKTHLMESIGNYLYAQKGDDIKICYISAETFTNEFVASIREKSTEKFKKKYRNLDVLLLDDVHFLDENKDAVQEELFYTFNSLYDRKCQMVFTCDRPINEVKGLEERLRTRFSRGLKLNLSMPSYETRRAILEKKLASQEKPVDIPADVIDYIAKNVKTNIRDLESCLTQMIAFSDLVGKPITIQVAQDQLRDSLSSSVSGSISMDTIQKVVANHYGISISDIKSKHRQKKLVFPRQIAIYISREITEYSFPDIAQEFGGKDHTTIMHSYQKIQDQMKTDSSLASTIDLLIREIKDYKN